MDRDRPYFTTRPPQPTKDSHARTWQIDRGVSEDINRLAAELECFPSDLVNMLLSRAIDAIETGQWVVQRKPVKYSLHWGQDPSSVTQT